MTRPSKWNFLEPRSSSSSKELFIKGTRIRASVVASGMIANSTTIEQEAFELGIPVEAAREAIAYAEQNKALLDMESSIRRGLAQMEAGNLHDLGSFVEFAED